MYSASFYYGIYMNIMLGQYSIPLSSDDQRYTQIPYTAATNSKIIYA